MIDADVGHTVAERLGTRTGVTFVYNAGLRKCKSKRYRCDENAYPEPANINAVLVWVVTYELAELPQRHLLFDSA